MMETVRFADILFILIVSVITGGILYLVHRSSAGKKVNQNDVVSGEEPAADD